MGQKVSNSGRRWEREKSLGWGGGDGRGRLGFRTFPSLFYTFLPLVPAGLLQNVILLPRCCSLLGQHQETIAL